MQIIFYNLIFFLQYRVFCDLGLNMIKLDSIIIVMYNNMKVQPCYENGLLQETLLLFPITLVAVFLA